MVCLDFSQVAISNLHQQLKKKDDRRPKIGFSAPEPEGEPTVEPDHLRSMILNSIRKYVRQFGNEYGQMVICIDDHSYWRKTYYPQYKAHREKDRQDSGIDWPLVYQTLDSLRDELRKYFPYKVLQVGLAEADDIIGVLAKNFHQEKIMIVSGDHDFGQLQIYPNVTQFAPVSDEYVKVDDPAAFLREHIIQGDKRDGVPNFLSPDDVFVTEGSRQASVFKTKLAVWLQQKPEEFCDETTIKYYRRNQKMVDLNQIPDEIQAAILEEYAKPVTGDRSKIYGYLVKRRMTGLLEMIRDF